MGAPILDPMKEPVHGPVLGPASWTRDSVGHPDQFALVLGDQERAELVGEVIRLGSDARGVAPHLSPPPPPAPHASHLGQRFGFVLPRLDALLERAQREVQSGRGLALLRGLPIDGLTLAQFTLAVWAVGSRFGHALSQNAQGEQITQVIDASSIEETPRMYRSKLELRLHNDITAMISLACWQPSMEGGLSYLASAGAIHNEILERAPHFLAPLYRGFHYHRLGEEGQGEAPVTPYRMPVFVVRSGQLSCRYQRAGIAAGHRALGVPLTDIEIEAMDMFDAVAKAPHNRLAFPLERGDMVVINNYAVLHARTGFTEYPEPEKRRLLVRLWLDRDGFRDVPPELNLFAANGIPPQPGRACTFDFKALYASDPRATGGVPKLEDALS